MPKKQRWIGHQSVFTYIGTVDKIEEFTEELRNILVDHMAAQTDSAAFDQSSVKVRVGENESAWVKYRTLNVGVKAHKLYTVIFDYNSTYRTPFVLFFSFLKKLAGTAGAFLYGDFTFEVAPPPPVEPTLVPVISVDWEDIETGLQDFFSIALTDEQKAWLRKEYRLHELADRIKDGFNSTTSIDEIIQDGFDNNGELFDEFAQQFGLPYEAGNYDDEEDEDEEDDLWD